MMPTEMIVGGWNPSKKDYRLEMVCYGPQICAASCPAQSQETLVRKGMPHAKED